jgi:hypothetical protein
MSEIRSLLLNTSIKGVLALEFQGVLKPRQFAADA